MRRHIPEKLQPPALFSIRTGFPGGIDHAPDAYLDYGEG